MNYKILFVMIFCITILSISAISAAEVNDIHEDSVDLTQIDVTNSTIGNLNRHDSCFVNLQDDNGKLKVDFNSTVDLSKSHLYEVNNEQEFSSVMDELDSPQRKYDINVINLKDDTDFNFDTGNEVLFNFRSGVLLIYGNNTHIKCNGENFLLVGPNAQVYITNCTISGCKPAIHTYGKCFVMDSDFDNNKRSSTIRAHDLKREVVQLIILEN